MLVVGQGMLGQALLRRSTQHTVFPSRAINWREPDEARLQLADLGSAFGRSIDGPWRLAWCAGAGVVGTSVSQFADEQSYLVTFLDSLRGVASTSLGDVGRVCFASSAGGVFGSGSSEWITEDSPESPISPYGISKLVQEQLIIDWSNESGVPVLVARISNLYGPGQNLAKAQGFISQLLRSMLVRRPFRLGVSGDTQRDFIHVDDAAARIDGWMSDPGESGLTRKLVVAGHSHTLLTVSKMVRSVTRIPPKIMYAATAGSEFQPRHHRFVSRVRTDLDAAAPSRPLEVGISQTWLAMLRGFSRGSFS